MYRTIWNHNRLKTAIALFGEGMPTAGQQVLMRIEDDTLDDGTCLWDMLLHSRTVLFKGAYRGYRSFKIVNSLEFCFDSMAQAYKWQSDLCEQQYFGSGGAEYVVVSKAKLAGAACDYAIRKERFNDIEARLASAGRAGFSLSYFVGAGGVKVNTHLTQGEARENELLASLVAAAEENADYACAFGLLGKYVDSAVGKGCFSCGAGMGLFIDNIAVQFAETKAYEARLIAMSDANNKASFSCWYREDKPAFVLTIPGDSGAANGNQRPVKARAKQGMLRLEYAAIQEILD